LPCLLLNSESPVQELRILSDEYYPLEFNISSHATMCQFYVKRRTRGSQQLGNVKAILTQRALGRASTLLPHFAQMNLKSTSNQFVAAFTEYFGSNEWSAERSTAADFVSRCVHECLSENTPEALGVYLTLNQGIRAINSKFIGAVVQFLWDLRLIRTYYQEQRQGNDQGSTKRLLDTDLLLPSLFEGVDQALSS
jgi:Anaphase-promoting complex sub unit 1 C-terminal domain